MNNFKTAISAFTLIVAIIFSNKAIAASESYTAKISNIRVESSYGFITMEGTLPWAQELSCSHKRVWVDLRDDLGKIQYS